MPLDPVADERGLWVNTDCPPTGPGVHALIIGVSRYDHLNEGRNPAPDTYGLGQLSVSALTAYRFFAWLGDGYALDGWPVARVRLLMSPLRNGVGKVTTDELKDCDPTICAHAPEASFDNCKHAIENWYADMEALRAPATGRSLFFFSGHGMERRQNYQVLLPSDYLRPPGRLMNNAISTPNLVDSLTYLACVASHVLLLDGCRNDIDKLRGATGANILNDNQPIAVNPLFEKGALYATASGLRAYSPKSGGLSLFGQALLDGLRNKPVPMLDEAPIELIRKGNVSAIEINKLGSYMKRRVDALIRAAKESVVQVVRSEVASANPGQAIELAELPHPSHSDELMVEEIELDGVDYPGPNGPGHGAVRHGEPPAPDAWFQQRYQAAQRAATAPPGADRNTHIERLHQIFGSEAVACPWLDTLRVTGLSTLRSDDHTAVDILSSAQATKTEELHRLQVHFRVASPEVGHVSRDPVGHVMTMTNEQGHRFCCVLPSDIYPRIFQLEIDVANNDYIRFATYLSPLNDGPAGLIAAAWDEMRARDPLAAAQRVIVSGTATELGSAFKDGEKALAEKLGAPLAAAVAGVLLLKGNRFDLMHDWARNVGNWFPTIPDGVVVWTEQCRRIAAGQPLPPDLLPWFVHELSHRSLPFTADGFGLAADLVTDIVRGRLRTDAATRDAARALGARIDAALPYFRDTGLFCTFAGWPEDWSPAAILGPSIL
jgi:hypothetical protein